ncbi:hypothetical protein [Oscillatoria salina]|uniref:hypothetical protein n=1 Tax=Oscillatoria salina TaxID=331517 RepID=UPI001CCC8B4A|nr:hypothetical protein [Oscillatoria salina]MBZ8181779.1 hypothetical protein [Oscillatoria salina IIICB1]
MLSPWRYWRIRTVKSNSSGLTLATAKQFFQTEFPDLCEIQTLSRTQEHHIQLRLLSEFRTSHSSPDDLYQAALAGLCLRCYVSHSIAQACQTIAHRFGDRYNFTCEELLPTVLLDDGKELLILERQTNSQLIYNHNEITNNSQMQLFAIEILASYQLGSRQESLSNWAFRLTKQNQDLKQFLLVEYGLEMSSPWSLLNKVREPQLKYLTQQEREIVKSFHAVYRRDYLRKAKRGGKCPHPTSAQLLEMLKLLQKKEIFWQSSSNCPEQKIREFQDKIQEIAENLRADRVTKTINYPHYRQIKSLELSSLEENSTEFEFICEKSSGNLEEIYEKIAKENIRFLLPQLLEFALSKAIDKAIDKQIFSLGKSRKYVSFADKFIPALRLIYCQSKSQKEVAEQLQFSNQSQLSRVLNLRGILSHVREQTTDIFLSSLLQHSPTKHSREALDNLTKEVEFFLDEEVFLEAATETQKAKSRIFQSLYAQKLQIYLDKKGT